MKITKLTRTSGLLMIVAAALFIAVTANAAPGDLYVADYNAGTIYKYTPPDSTASVFASGLSNPGGLAFDNAGNLFEADRGSGTIYKFSPDGTSRTAFATGLSDPIDLAFNNAGILFGTDYGSGTIYKFSPDGTSRTAFATGIQGPAGLAFDNEGNLFVAEYSTGKIYKYTPDGTARSDFATVPTRAEGLAFDSDGYLFVADPSNANHMIHKFAPDGTPAGTFNSVNSPSELAFDNAGNLFVTDGAIWIFTPDGTRNLFASGLNFPDGLAIQPQVQPTFAAHIQQPINSDGTSVFNVKRGVVPVKFTLTQGGSATCVLAPATMALTRTAGSTTGAIDESVYTMSADTGPNFRINSCQYVYNLSASALGAGTYRVDIKINGQVVGSGTFALK